MAEEAWCGGIKPFGLTETPWAGGIPRLACGPPGNDEVESTAEEFVPLGLGCMVAAVGSDFGEYRPVCRPNTSQRRLGCSGGRVERHPKRLLLAIANANEKANRTRRMALIVW
ncbi:MAG: hypothetical protein ACK5PB_06810 [Pirellula sp.]|jgi:hypothetical protein